jgi:predicted DsbA family dithiol-disulfide isomerase
MFDILVVSDVMCPWCFVGKRKLEGALALLGQTQARVQWRPFQLDPTIPPGGVDRRQYLQAKFGSGARAGALYSNIKKAGEEVGIAFDFDAIKISPNTLDAHRLISWAAAEGRQDAAVERLFADYFLAGRDIGDHQVLAEAAEAAGMDGARVKERLAGDEDRETVAHQVADAARAGIRGVPTFIFDGRYALSGAQASETLAEVARQVIAEKAEEKTASS